MRYLKYRCWQGLLAAVVLLSNWPQASLAEDNTQMFKEMLAMDQEWRKYMGQVVLSVNLVVPEGEKVDDLRNLIDLYPGYLLTLEDLEATIKRLYALERFASIEIGVEQQFLGVVDIYFYLKPLKRLKEIKVNGLHGVVLTDFLRELKINEGDFVTENSKQKILKNSLAYLRRLGFRAAKAQLFQESAKFVDEVSLILEIDQGEPTRISKLTFMGAVGVPKVVLYENMDTEVGDILNLDKLLADRQKLLQLFYAQDFLSATLSLPVVKFGDREAEVTFKLDLGKRTAISFVGNRLLSDKQLLEMWQRYIKDGLGVGDLNSFAKRIVKEYEFLGYPQAEVEIKGYIDYSLKAYSEGVLRYVFLIEEGARVNVTEIRFTGLKDLSPFKPETLAAQVRELLEIKLADPSMFQSFNQDEGERLWQSSLAYKLAVESEKVALPLKVPKSACFVKEFYDKALDDILFAYHNLGYLKMRFLPLTLHKLDDFGNYRVDIPLSEGEQTFIKNIIFQDNHLIEAAELLKAMEQATKELNLPTSIDIDAPLSFFALEEARIALLKYYRDQGFLYVKVNSEIDMNKDHTAANIYFKIEEGPRVRIDHILLRGNHYTKDQVIKKRITFKAGDLYRLNQILDNQRAIASLGVFSEVKLKLLDEEHRSATKDLIAEVTERKRQPLEIALGASLADGPRLKLSYANLNMLGTASALTSSLKINRQIFFNFYGQYAEEMRYRYQDFHKQSELLKGIERELRVGLITPPLIDLPFRPVLRLDLVNERDNTIKYSLDSGAAIVGFDFFTSKYAKVSLEPQISLTNLACFSGQRDAQGRSDCSNIPEFRLLANKRIDNGLHWTFKFVPSLVYDHRDSPLRPTKGLYSSLKFTYAYGGAKEEQNNEFTPFSFAKGETMWTWYWPLKKHVFMNSLRAGTIHPLFAKSGVPIEERYYLGGRSSLRGFIEGALLPEDSCLALDLDSAISKGCKDVLLVSKEDGSYTKPLPNGGRYYVLAKSEFRLLLVNNLFLELFIDAGNLWAYLPDFVHNRFKVRLSTGAGLRYDTPVGAISFDVGINPNPRKYYGLDGVLGNVLLYTEPSWQMHFSVGAL